MIKCNRCQGMVFLDRTFSDNKNFETFCIMCGERKFISKESGFGQWLDKIEAEKALNAP